MAPDQRARSFGFMLVDNHLVHKRLRDVLNKVVVGVHSRKVDVNAKRQ